MTPSHRRGLLLGAAAFAAWGLLSPGNEILLRQYPPMWMQVFRGGLALLILLAMWRGRLLNVPDVLRKPGMTLTLVIGTFLSFALFAYAQTRIPAAYTTLGFYMAPLWTAIFSWFMLREHVGKYFVPAVALLLAGGYFALTGGGALPAPDPLGMLLAVGSGMMWGIYAVLLRRYAHDIDWRDLLVTSMLVGTLGFLTLAALSEPFPDLRTFTANTWFWTAILVAIPTLAALALFQAAVRHAPAGQVNILVAIELAATIFFAWWILDANFTAVQLGGMALSLVSVSGYLWVRNRPGQNGAADVLT